MDYGASLAVIKSSDLQKAFEYFNTAFWQQTPEFLKEKYALVQADRIDFRLIAEEGRSELRMKTWAPDVKAVKDAIVRSEDDFWKKFNAAVGGFIGRAIADLPCIP